MRLSGLNPGVRHLRVPVVAGMMSNDSGPVGVERIMKPQRPHNRVILVDGVFVLPVVLLVRIEVDGGDTDLHLHKVRMDRLFAERPRNGHSGVDDSSGDYRVGASAGVVEVVDLLVMGIPGDVDSRMVITMPGVVGDDTGFTRVGVCREPDSEGNGHAKAPHSNKFR